MVRPDQFINKSRKFRGSDLLRAINEAVPKPVGGRGIRVERQGNNFVISQTGHQIIGGAGGGRAHPAKITERFDPDSDGFNYQYKAVAFQGGAVVDTFQDPINRMYDIAEVDFLPAPLWGDPNDPSDDFDPIRGTCLILEGVVFDPQGDEVPFNHLVVMEFVRTEQCIQ